MVDCLPCGVGTFNLYMDGRLELVQINESFYRILNVTSEEFEPYTGFNFVNCVFPDDWFTAQSNLIEVMRSKKTAEFNIRILNHENEYQWIRVMASVAFEEISKAVMYLSFFDIDKQEKIKYEMQKGSAATRFITNRGFVSIWIYDIDKNIIEPLFDITKENNDSRVTETPEAMVAQEIIYKEDSKKFLSCYRDIRMGSAFSEETIRVNNKKSGKIEWQHFRLNRVRRLDGNGYAAVGFSTNADLQRDAQQQYEYELKSNQKHEKGKLSHFRVNLTTHMVEEIHTDEFDGSQIVLPAALDKLMECGLLHNVVDEDSMLLKQLLNIETQLESYEKGQRTDSIVYRRALPQIGIKWIEMTVSRVKRSATNEVIAFYSTRDVDASYKARLAIKKVLEEETENIILVNPGIKTAQYIMDNSVIMDFEYEHNLFSTDVFVNQIMDSVAEEDIEKTSQFLNVDTMYERLGDKSVLQCSYCVKNTDGNYRRKKARLLFLDESRTEILYIQRDITDIYIEEQRQKAILQEAINKEQLANRVKNDFMTNMSHDLRTPLNAIMGFIALTFDEADNLNTVKENMTQMRSVSDYMLELVEDILEASKLQNEAFELNLGPYSYQEFEKGVKTMFAAQCRQKGISFTMLHPKTRVQIITDKVRINQVVFNLLSNAIHFTPQGGHVCLEVGVVNRKHGITWVDITVTDDGIGMSYDFQKKMYEPFSQENTSTMSELQGVGLGLCITKKLVNAMGGTIEIQSEPGRGTTARVHFSFEIYQGPELFNDVSMVLDREFAGLCGKTVLLVEDNPINAAIARKLLEKKSIIVIGACNGREAVEMFEASDVNLIDAILMDIRMPEMDGYNAACEIRAMSRADSSKIPIIAMSANAFKEDKQRSLLSGMNSHLSKPIEPKLLYETLEEALRSIK